MKQATRTTQSAIVLASSGAAKVATQLITQLDPARSLRSYPAHHPAGIPARLLRSTGPLWPSPVRWPTLSLLLSRAAARRALTARRAHAELCAVNAQRRLSRDRETALRLASRRHKTTTIRREATTINPGPVAFAPVPIPAPIRRQSREWKEDFIPVTEKESCRSARCHFSFGGCHTAVPSFRARRSGAGRRSRTVRQTFTPPIRLGLDWPKQRERQLCRATELQTSNRI